MRAKANSNSLIPPTFVCPSTFDGSIAEERTAWTLSKTSDQTDLVNPSDTPYSFTVAVTEVETSHNLVVRGQLVITNSGQLDATLWNVVANLQTGGHATVASATANHALACDEQGIARTCFGTFNRANGSRLVLLDPQSNDVIALSGLIDIPPSTCDNARVLNFVGEFDAGSLGLVAGQSARLEVLVTFGSAGTRGGSPDSVSCTLDVNCNGIIDPDGPATCNVDESETNNIRTIPTRTSFVVPPSTPVCNEVTLVDTGASVGEPAGCGAITASNTIHQTISAIDDGGSTSTYTIGSSLSCTDDTCASQVNNLATLTCNTSSASPLASLISGSPASASIDFSCSGGTPPIETGDFCTYTQGAYKATCRNGNPPAACLLQASFGTSFPNGLFIGDGVTWTGASQNDGTSAIFDGGPFFAAGWLNSSDVQGLLSGAPGTPGVLTEDLPDGPASTSAGNLANQLITTTLNVKLNLDSALVGKDTTIKLADLIAVGGCQINASGTVMPTGLDGLTVRQILDLAERTISGDTTTGFVPSALTAGLDVINQSFDGCASNWGCLRR